MEAVPIDNSFNKFSCKVAIAGGRGGVNVILKRDFLRKVANEVPKLFLVSL